MARFNIAIVGGGLCGLVLALALEKYAPDVEYQVYEAVPELTTAGAGVALQRRTLIVLRELGLEPALLKISGNGSEGRMSILYRKSDQREGFTFSEADQEMQWTVHRGELQKLFLEHICHPERVHLGKRLASYVQPKDADGPIELRFQDGSSTSCDVLFGADGVKSTVRAVMFTQLADAAKDAGCEQESDSLRSCIPAAWSGTTVYRGLLERDPIADGKPPPLNMSHLMIYCGQKKSLVAYPISKGRVLNVVAVVTNPELGGTVYEGPWTADASVEEVRSLYAGWEPEVEDVLQNVGSWSKWAIHVVNDLPTFVDGRVVLFGDAAHGMTPHQGAGAGQGFEDALMLGQFIGQSNVTKDNIHTAFKIYDSFRRPFTQRVAAASMQMGLMHSLIHPELNAPVTSSSVAGEYLAKIVENIERFKEWRRENDLMEDCQSTLRLLQEKIIETS